MTEFAPVQVIILAVLSGIIGLVITGFTGWHIYLCVRGQTTIECLEKTRYLAGVRRQVEQNRHAQHELDRQHKRGLSDGGISESLQRAKGQILEFHANAVPGASRYEEGEEHSSPTPSVQHEVVHANITDSMHRNVAVSQERSPAQQALRKTYRSYETDRERERYEEYLDDRETDKMPNAFDLGWRKNLVHVFGPNRLLWLLPVLNSIGDGWRWEVSPKWLAASEEAARRKEHRLREAQVNHQYTGSPQQAGGAGRHYSDAEADSYDGGSYINGRGSMSMQTFNKSSKKQRPDFDAGEDGEVDRFEVSDSSSEVDSEGERTGWRSREH